MNSQVAPPLEQLTPGWSSLTNLRPLFGNGTPSPFHAGSGLQDGRGIEIAQTPRSDECTLAQSVTRAP